MYQLSNPELSVLILDPVRDSAREGSRYCGGGYIWQITDAHLGDLLSGPEFPQEPSTFNGQGLPDMFQRALGSEDAPVGGEVGCIGVGRVRRTSPKEPFDVRFNPEVIEFLNWEVSSRPAEIVMTTTHTFRGWSYSLKRSLALQGRTILSRTTIANTGESVLPIRWFAHPFFPLTGDHVLCRFSLPVTFPENPGYALNAEGFITRKPQFNWERGGWYQPMEYAKEGNSFSIVEKHPKIGQVTVTTDFLPSFLPIWGNDRTFSFEPYYERELSAAEQAAWSISYQF